MNSAQKNRLQQEAKALASIKFQNNLESFRADRSEVAVISEESVPEEEMY